MVVTFLLSAFSVLFASLYCKHRDDDDDDYDASSFFPSRQVCSWPLGIVLVCTKFLFEDVLRGLCCYVSSEGSSSSSSSKQQQQQRQTSY